MLTLKEQIDADIFGIFLNIRDFGVLRIINGVKVLCLIEKNNVHMRASAGRRTSAKLTRHSFLSLRIAIRIHF